MKKVAMDAMEEYINSINEVSKENKKQYKGKIIANLIIAIIAVCYFIAMVYMKKYLNENIFSIIYTSTSGAILVLTLVIIEIAYYKDNDNLSIHAMELVCYTIINLLFNYILKQNSLILKIILGIIPTYYIIKSIVIYKKARNKILREKNDIGEIIKKESQDKLKPEMEKLSAQNETVTKRKRGRPKGTTKKKMEERKAAEEEKNVKKAKKEKKKND